MPKTFAQRVAEEQAALRRQSRSATSASRLQNASLDDTDLPVFGRDGRLKSTWGKQPDGSYGGLVRESPAQPTPTAPMLTVGELGAVEVTHDGGTTDFEKPLIHGHLEVHSAYSPDGEPPLDDAYHLASTIRDRDGGATTILCPTPGFWFVRLRMVGQDRTTKGPFSPAVSAEIIALKDAQAMKDVLEAAQQAITTARNQLNESMTELDAKLLGRINEKLTHSELDPPAEFEGAPGDIWRVTDGDGTVQAEFEWSGDVWEPRQVSSAVISNLDVGKLTAGAGELGEAVIELLWARVARAKLLEADEAIIGGAILKNGAVSAEKLDVTQEMVARFAEILHLVADKVEMNEFIADSGMVGLLEAIGITLANEGAGTRFVVSGDGWRLEELDGTVLASVGVGSPLTARGAEIEGVLTAKFADDSATRLTSGPVTYREGYNSGESWGLSYRNRTSVGPHQRFLRDGVPENDSPAVVWDENGDLVLAPQQSAVGTGAIRVPGPLAVERLLVEGNSRVSGNFSALGSLGTYQSINFPNSFSANRPCFYRQIGNAILLSGAINSNVNGNFGGSMSQLPAPSTPMNLMGFRYNHSANQIAPMCLIVGVDGWLFAPNGRDISSNTPVSLDGLFYFI